jgi:hypothetical protein
MPDEQKKMVYIKDDRALKIKAVAPDNSSIESSTVLALLLFDIRYELQVMNDNLMDIEEAVKKGE